MSTRADAAPSFPGPGLWVMLAMIVAAGLAHSWGIAGALLLLTLVNMARPFDVITAFLVVVIGAAFVTNSGGGLTLQLGMLTAVILIMLLFYVLTNTDRVFSIARSAMTWPLVAFMLLSLANAVRGLLVGNMPRNLGLELIAVLGLGSALVVANAFEARRDLYLATVGLIVIAFLTAAWGLLEFSITKSHTATGYTVALPGIMALMLVNHALRAPKRIMALLWTALSLPLFLHQFSTFGRGLWTGCVAGILFSVIAYGGRGRGAAARWGRSALVVGMIVGLGLFGAVQMAVFLGQGDLLQEAAIRVTSITSTKTGIETRSNMIRLFEYATVIPLIQKSPWFGYGLGFTFSVEEPFSAKTYEQWGVHQNFLLIWLKQGLVGLGLFLWLLWSAVAMGAREARRHADPWTSSWFASAAAATIFLVVFSLSNYPFAVVNEMFLLALLWGGAMAMSRKGFVKFGWSPPLAEMLEMRPDDVRRAPSSRRPRQPSDD